MSDHHTMKKFVADAEHKRVCADKGTVRKVSDRQMCSIRRIPTNLPLQSKKQVEATGASGDPPNSICKIFKKYATVL